MSPPEDKTLIEKAFDPQGPVYDGPKSKGRRAYDQTFWWVRVVKEVGFPIVAAWWVATRLLPAIERLEVTQSKSTDVLTALICKLSPEECTRTLMQRKPPLPPDPTPDEVPTP